MDTSNHSLIPVFESTINNQVVQTVDARVLHAFLESKRQFSNWITYQIEAFEFTQDVDFVTINNSGYSPPRKEYHVSLDMAKELSMVERNSKGKEARQYFIAVEKAYREQRPKELTREQILVMALEAERERLKLAAQVEVMTPKAEYYDQLLGANEVFDGEQTAKMLRTSRNNLYTFLKQRGIITKSNLPMQLYVDKDYMRVKQTPYNDVFGNPKVSLKIVFTQNGIKYVRGLMGKILIANDVVAA